MKDPQTLRGLAAKLQNQVLKAEAAYNNTTGQQRALNAREAVTLRNCAAALDALADAMEARLDVEAWTTDEAIEVVESKWVRCELIGPKVKP